MPGKIEARLAELGLALPPAAAPLANYVPFSRVPLGGGTMLVVVSGQVPLEAGRIAVTGKLGGGLGPDQGRAAARTCFLNVLAQLSVACDGELDRVKQIIRLGGFIACTGEFTQHPAVMNGASDLAVELFGDIGRHARTTIGVPSLPGDAAVEVEGMFETAT